MFKSDSVAKTLNQALIGNFGPYFKIGLISAVINLLMLTGSMFMLQVYDRVLPSNSTSTLIALSLLVVGLYSFYGILSYVRTYSLGLLAQSIDAQFSEKCFEKTVTMPLIAGVEQKNRKIDLVQDLETVRKFLGGNTPNAIFDVFWMPAYFGLLYILHPWLCYLAIFGAILITFCILLSESANRQNTRTLSAHSQERNQTISNIKRNAEVVTVMGLIDSFKKKWGQDNKDYLWIQRTRSLRSRSFSIFIKTFRMTLQSGVLALGAYLVILHEITPGVMIAASIITGRGLAPIEQLVASWPSILSARYSYYRLNKFLNVVDDENAHTDIPLPSKELSVENLQLSTVNLDRIGNVSGFKLHAGNCLVVIGPSGSGKTSFVRSLLGVLPVNAGSVRFDGAELSQWSHQDVSKFVGYLPQDIELFDGTIADNISRFDPNFDNDKLLEAAEMAGVLELVKSLPNGFDTQIGCSNTWLSSGQQQRIALARAVYGNPFLVVLDEPNSNLDNEGDQALLHTIKKLSDRGSIVILVSHRKSILVVANKILAMAQGHQVQFGDRNQVLGQMSMAQNVNKKRASL